MVFSNRILLYPSKMYHLWICSQLLKSKKRLNRPQVRCIAFDTQELTGWDSGLLTFPINVIDGYSQNNIHVDKGGLLSGQGKVDRLHSFDLPAVFLKMIYKL